MMWGWDGHMGWGWTGLSWIIFLLFIGAVVWFAATATRRNSCRQQEETPEQVLKRRYAKGEVDRETYQRMLDDLRK